MGLDVAAYRSGNLGLDFRFTLSRNNNEILNLGGEPFIDHNSGSASTHVAGFPLASVFRKRVVSADLVSVDGRNEPMNVMCESGPLVPGGNFSRGGGPPVPCADAPEVYWGQPLPVWEGGIGANVTLFRNLHLYALVDFVGGRTFENGDVMHAHLTFRQTRAMQERTDPILLGYPEPGHGRAKASRDHRRRLREAQDDLRQLHPPAEAFADAVQASRITATVTARTCGQSGRGRRTSGTATSSWTRRGRTRRERHSRAGGVSPGKLAADEAGHHHAAVLLLTTEK